MDFVHSYRLYWQKAGASILILLVEFTMISLLNWGFSVGGLAACANKINVVTYQYSTKEVARNDELLLEWSSSCNEFILNKEIVS